MLKKTTIKILLILLSIVIILLLYCNLRYYNRHLNSIANEISHAAKNKNTPNVLEFKIAKGYYLYHFLPYMKILCTAEEENIKIPESQATKIDRYIANDGMPFFWPVSIESTYGIMLLDEDFNIKGIADLDAKDYFHGGKYIWHSKNGTIKIELE